MSLKETYKSRKQLIASNLQAKGVSASVNDGLTTLAGKILLIKNDVFDLSASADIIGVGNTVTFTSHVSPFEDDTKVELYKNGVYVEDMVNKGSGVYESNIVCDEAGVFSFHAKLNDKITETVKVTVRSPTNLKITSITGLRTLESDFIEYLYDGDEFTVTGTLQDDNSNPLSNQEVEIFIRDDYVCKTVTDENGIFTATVINPYHNYPSEFNNMALKAIYRSTELYFTSEDSSTIVYRRISLEDEPFSFNYLQKLINIARDNQIHLTHNYNYQYGDATNGVVINKELTINGHGYTIDGKYMARIFVIREDTILNNVIMVNAIASDGYYGGCINHDSGSLEINDCTFDNCRTKDDSVNYSGGAIYTQGTRLTVKDSIFNNCWANHEGGAISSLMNVIVSLTDSTFTNCSAKYNGGAIYDKGGNAGGSLTINGCTFANNTVTGFSTGEWNGGGAIYAQVICNISNSSFLHNTVSDATTHQYPYGGGALYLGGTSTGSNITNCIFDSNIARFGGVSFHGGTSTYSRCIFLNNYATDQGGVILVSGITSKVIDSIILNNNSAVSSANDKLFCSYSGGSGFTLDYNWWGHNNSNKGSLTPVIPAKPDNSTLDKWLYVTATVDNDSISVGDKARMKYDLNHYATSSADGVYDAKKLPLFDLDIGTSLGALNKSKVIINEGVTDIVEFTSQETGTAEITVSKKNIGYISTTINVQ